VGHQVRILENEPCGNGVAGCEGRKGGRGFKVGTGSGWEILDDIWDVSGASWLDVDDDVSTYGDSGMGYNADVQGTLDIMIQRSGEQGAGTVTFVKNSFYHDAFFLKAQGRFCSLGVGWC